MEEAVAMATGSRATIRVYHVMLDPFGFENLAGTSCESMAQKLLAIEIGSIILGITWVI